MKKVVVRTRPPDFSKVKKIVKNLTYPTYVDEDERRITIYAPNGELDKLIETLRLSMDERYKENVIEVTSPDFVISSALSRTGRGGEGRTPVEGLVESTRPYTKLDFGKAVLTSIAGLIALIGLLMNNSVIVIGAMLLSPLLGPVHGFAINVAVGRMEDALKSVFVLLALLGFVMILSFISTLVVNMAYPLQLTGEILMRAKANPIYVPMAVMLGFASILAMERELPSILVGVAITVALLPPAVDAGLLFVLLPALAVSSTVIMLQNLVGLMAGSLMAVIALRIGPRRYYEKTVARKFIVRSLFVITVLLSLITLMSLLPP